MLESQRVVFYGKDSKRGGAWGPIRGSGGLWLENVVQAISRDLMAEAMVRVERAGYPVVLTVHDEIVSECDPEHGSQREFQDLMAWCPPWAEGCPIATVALETAAVVPEVSDSCGDGFASWIDEATEALVEHGLPRRRARPLAIHCVSAIEGALILSRSARDLEPLETVIRQATRAATAKS